MGRVVKHSQIIDTVTGEITGKVLQEDVKFGTQNGDGWVIMYREAISLLADTAPDLTTVKVFLKLAAKQGFEDGVKTTKKAISDEIGVSRTQGWRAFKWLKENHYVKERKNRGQTEFLLNPNVTTCGKNKKAKIELWQSVE